MNAVLKTDASAETSLPALAAWVAEVAAMTTPDAIHWCDGTDAEDSLLLGAMQAKGTLITLDAATHPGCWLHRSQPDDVARTEHI